MPTRNSKIPLDIPIPHSIITSQPKHTMLKRFLKHILGDWTQPEFTEAESRAFHIEPPPPQATSTNPYPDPPYITAERARAQYEKCEADDRASREAEAESLRLKNIIAVFKEIEETSKGGERRIFWPQYRGLIPFKLLHEKGFKIKQCQDRVYMNYVGFCTLKGWSITF